MLKFSFSPESSFLYRIAIWHSCFNFGVLAVYKEIKVALRFGCTLVTLDREQRERASHALTACYPVEVLAETE